MPFELPAYTPPDFSTPPLSRAPFARFQAVTKPGVAPGDFHATTIYPEYFHLRPGHWQILEESRMDCVVVLQESGHLEVKEFRRLQVGEQVACGRKGNGEDGIYVHTEGFRVPPSSEEAFYFRRGVSRETSFSFDYDHLYQLLEHERRKGSILWVLGPALAFDHDARNAFVEIIERGFVHGLLAGNALAVHDVEGALFQTALGQEIYSKKHTPQGHCKHLDTINRIRSAGSIEKAVREGMVGQGIMHSLLKHHIPFCLAGSIRDDGPLPEVIPNVYDAQDAMRTLARKATTVIALATQLHTIATGNMLPSYRVMPGGHVRPVYFYIVDMSEFATLKLGDRGSLGARSILTNVQDFVVTLNRGLKGWCSNG